MISWACASPALSDKIIYPTFVRTAGPYKTLGKPFAGGFCYLNVLERFVVHFI